MPISRKDKNNAFSANRKIIQDFMGYFSNNGKPTNIIYYPLKGPETQQMFKDQLTNRKFGLKFKSLLSETMDKLFDKKYNYNDYSNIPNYQWFATKDNKDFFVFHILTLGEYKGKVVYYYALTITPCDEDGQQTKGAYTLVEVINYCDKVSEDKFYDNVKQALSKVNLNNKKRISVIASTSMERKFKFKDGSVITAYTVEEAKAKHKITAAQNFGVLDADKSGDKRSETELPKSNAMFVIQRKDGTFMTTNTTINTGSLLYNHDDVRFVKDINKADIFFYANRAKGIMNFVKKYNPSFEMEVKKLKLSV